jgi:lipopolysaccharide transport system permease protein
MLARAPPFSSRAGPDYDHAPVQSSRRQLNDFVWTLVRTDFKARYHGAPSGFIWALLKPLLMFLVLFAVFSFLFRDATYVYNLLIGLLLWDFFAESSRAGLHALLSKGFLLTKARFPRWIPVLTSTANAVITLLVFALAIVVVISIGHRVPGPAALALFVIYLVCYFFICVGFALGASVLFLKYRDLDQVWDVTLQAGFFLTPIFYPLRILPEKYHFYLYLWPATPIVQFSRQVLVDGTLPTLKAHLLLFLMTAGIFLCGLLLFRQLAARAIEQL